MRWTLGEAEIRTLLDAGELQRVPLASELADALLTAARTHLTSARSLDGSDPDLAYTACYDACRKACAALLQAQGLRATSRGGHIAVRDAILAQFGHPPRGRVLRRLDQMRRRRNELEYPGGVTGPVTAGELAEAAQWADDIIGYCSALLPQLDRPF